MNGKILLILLTILFALPSFSQNSKTTADHESRRKEMMEFKLKFLADEMGLNDSQKKQFNELYIQMENERRTAHKKMKAAEKIIKVNKNASEADYDKASKDIAAAKAQMAQIEKNYDDKFSKFLTKKQLFKLREAEDKFKETVRKCRDKKKSEK